MKKRPVMKSVLGASFLIALIAAVIMRSSPKPGSIEFHVKAYKNTSLAIQRGIWAGKPAKLPDYLSARTWRWYLAGKPEATELFEAYERHSKELVKLGYLKSQTLVVTNWLSVSGSLEDSVAKMNLFEGRSPFLSIRIESPRSLRITGLPPEVESVLERIKKCEAGEKTPAE